MMMISTATFNRNFNSPYKQSRNPLGIDPCVSCFVFSISRLRKKNKNNNISLLQPKRISDRARGKPLQITSFSRWFDTREERENENEIYLREGETTEYNSLTNFVRFRDDGKDEGELQTAVVTYRKRLPWSILQPRYQVDLVAAVHLADKDFERDAIAGGKMANSPSPALKWGWRRYFASFQKELASYDRVLYEMVVNKDPEQTNKDPNLRWMPPKKMPGGRDQRSSIVGIIQRFIAQILRLDFQLDCLDYRMANWYHADLDYETFKSMQFERGESIFKIAKELTSFSHKAVTKSVFVPKDLDTWRSKLLWASRVLPLPLVAVFLIESVCTLHLDWTSALDLDLTSATKVFLAKLLTSELTDGTTDLVEKSVIIGERNKVAIRELQGAMHDGCKKIAILYGAGHMPDLDRRLKNDFGLVPKKISWRTAWSIKNWKTTNKKQLPSFLNSIAKSSDWQLNGYQILALLIFSLVLAVDLWFWELFLSSIKEWAGQNLLAALQFLEQT